MADQQPDPTAETEQEPAAPDVAEENRRRMREALAHKRGVEHPDDAARRTGGVRSTTPPPGGRDFTRRKSG